MKQQTTSHSHFKYRGDLAETPLPEVLSRVARFQVPGVIEAVLEDVTTEIFIQGGQVVHARSSDLGNSLGAYLRRIGRLSQDEFRRVMRERRQTTKRLGVVLVERGLMSPMEVRDAVQRQTEAIVWSLFSWWQGEVTFHLGEWEAEDMIAIQLSLPQVIVNGIRRESDVRPLIARIGGRNTVLESSWSTEDAVEIGLDADDYKLLSLADGQRTLYELCAEGPRSAQDNAKLLYAFFVLGLVGPSHERGSEAMTAPVPLRGFRRSE